MKTREQNRHNKRTEIERFDWFIERIQTQVILIGEARTLISRNQLILRFDIILQHDWLIEQRLLHIRVFFGGKTKSPCFDLFIHWLIKQITNTYRNHFSRSYENCSILCRWLVTVIIWLTKLRSILRKFWLSSSHQCIILQVFNTTFTVQRERRESRLSCMGWFSRALAFRSFYYPWGEMGTTRSLRSHQRIELGNSRTEGRALIYCANFCCSQYRLLVFNDTSGV